MLKIVWNATYNEEFATPALNGNLRSRISALLNNDVDIDIPEKERDQLYYKLQRLEWETEFIKKNRKRYLSLTKREREVMQLLLEGFNNPQIAKELYISRHTVEQHRKNINRKLNIRSIGEFFAFGYAFNLV